MQKTFEPPEWHRKELQKRTLRIQEGKVSYISLSQLKARVAKRKPHA